MDVPSSTPSQTERTPVRVELYYFDGCPNLDEAHDNVNAVVRELGIDADVGLIAITTDEEAVTSKFLGSPSVRIEGDDVEMQQGQEHEYSLRCRRYAIEGSIQGAPSKQMIRSAIRRALEARE